jgi:predicted nucleic acid-binding Zn ribbon protein
MSEMKRRKKTPERSLREIIEKFLKSAGLENRVDEYMAFTYWDSVVGKEVSKHTEPEKIADGTVFVKVNNDVWRNELAFFRNEIISKLNEKIGKNIVKEIRFY